MTKINRNCVSDQTLVTYQEASPARWISGRLGPSPWKMFWRTWGRWSCRSLRQPWLSKRPQSLPVTRHATSFHPWSSKASPPRWKRWLRHSWGPLYHSCWSTPQVWVIFFFPIVAKNCQRLVTVSSRKTTDMLFSGGEEVFKLCRIYNFNRLQPQLPWKTFLVPSNAEHGTGESSLRHREKNVQE